VRYLAGFSRYDTAVTLDPKHQDGPKTDAATLKYAVDKSQLPSKERSEKLVSKVRGGTKTHVSQLAVLEQLMNELRSNEASKVLKGPHRLLVGLDYLADEHYHPFCPFNLEEFIQFLRTERALRNGHFGFRYHCGECDEVKFTPLLKAHMGASAKVIIDVVSEFKDEMMAAMKANSPVPPPLRIGHGIAFRHYVELLAGQVNTIRSGQVTANTFATWTDAQKLLSWVLEAMELMRECFIPIEINFTSNELLAKGVDEHPVTFFIRNRFFLTMSTDNDGIWPCRHECVQPDGTRRILYSVAAEYARAIDRSDSLKADALNKAQLDTIVRNGPASRFDPVK